MLFCMNWLLPGVLWCLCRTTALSQGADFLAENNIETLDRPPQSPDMNPIENLWAIIKAFRKKKYGVPKTREVLIEQIFDVWNSIDA